MQFVVSSAGMAERILNWWGLQASARGANLYEVWRYLQNYHFMYFLLETPPPPPPSPAVPGVPL